MEEKALAFTKFEQIAEILKETERLRLPVLLRYSTEGKSVRGFIEKADLVNEKGIRIAGISPAGDALLANYDIVKVEFVLLSKKVYFVTKIRARTVGKILVNIPDKVVAVERRRNLRFRIPKDMPAFIEIFGKKIDFTRFDVPFCPEFLRDELMPNNGIRVKIDDISLGGLAGFTRFQAIAELIKPESDNMNVKIFLPPAQIVNTQVNIRWIKKSTVRLVPGLYPSMHDVFWQHIKPLGLKYNEHEVSETYWRFGLQFSEVTQELDGILRNFIRSLQTAESV